MLKSSNVFYSPHSPQRQSPSSLSSKIKIISYSEGYGIFIRSTYEGRSLFKAFIFNTEPLSIRSSPVSQRSINPFLSRASLSPQPPSTAEYCWKEATFKSLSEYHHKMQALLKDEKANVSSTPCTEAQLHTFLCSLQLNPDNIHGVIGRPLYAPKDIASHLVDAYWDTFKENLSWKAAKPQSITVCFSF